MQPKFSPWRLFFPSALLMAPTNVLIWLALRHGVVDWPVLVSATWHGREMLFGYTFAVIAGYLLQAMSMPLVICIWLLWLAGRLLWLVPPADLNPWLELLVGGAFPAVLATIGVSRFLSVKRVRNIAFPFIMGALGIAGLGSYATEMSLLPTPGRGAVVLSVYVVALLVMVMGGRAVATATVGSLRARGHFIMILPRPGLEAATVLGMLALLLLDGFGLPQAAGLVALAVSMILLLKMQDWNISQVLHDPEVWPLHLGFVWLAIGMALIGLEMLGLISSPDTGALHALAAGGIGTVTLVMMIRVTRQRAADFPASLAYLQTLQLILALAVFLRVCGGWALPEYRTLMLWLSAGAWTMAFGLSAAVILPAALRSSRASTA